MMQNEKAQLYTIEGIASAMLLVMVVIFVVRAAPMTPNTSSSAHQYLEAQLETQGQDLLIILDYVPEGSLNSPLKQAVIGWTGLRFEGQSQVLPQSLNYTANVLKEALADAGIAYNFELSVDTSSGVATYGILWNGKPSDNAVIVSRKIVLHDDDGVVATDKIQDMDPTTKFYNIVDVRLTLWRM
ncbi:MAG: hypothetical protein OIN66_04425 [Candidatus Methanoperedens sp.]|nr:hypothetical protein [Candidatus Methanoperedens sp.]